MTPRTACALVCYLLPLALTPSVALCDPPTQTLGHHSTARKILDSSLRVSLPGDELWWDGFGLPVTDGYVFRAIEFQGSIVIAGQFSRVGEVKANNIARWDGTGWAPLGAGIEWGTVEVLSVYGGDLIAAGWFGFAGGTFARSIARWNGVEWSTFGAGIHDPLGNPTGVRSVAAYHDTLIAAADLPWSGGSFRSQLLYWTGYEWSKYGGAANGSIHCLSVMDGSLFVGGTFDSIGGMPVSGVARWDGWTWHQLGDGIKPTWASVLSLIEYGGMLYAGGNFALADGLPVQNIAAWNGTTWESSGSGLPSAVSALAVTGDTLVAGCGNSISRWNGQDWEVLAPLVGNPASIVPHEGDLVVAGTIEATNPGEVGPTALSVARLASGTWHAFTDVTPTMRGLTDFGGGWAWISSMTVYRNRLVAAGSFDYAGAPPEWARIRDLAEWDGSKWTQFPLPPGVAQIVWLLATGDALYAAGSYYGDSFVSVYRYDGAQWFPLNGPMYVGAPMAFFQGELCAAGFSPVDPELGAIVSRWTGSGWAMIGEAQGPNIPNVTALIDYAGTLVVAGRFQAINGVQASNIAAWDGVEWRQFGPGLPSPPNFPHAMVRDLTVADGRLIVAGEAIGDSARRSVAFWSGSTWEPLGGEVGTVYRLGNVGGNLFASGDLYSLMRWDGNMWMPLGSGTNAGVTAFAALGNSIYFGGGFSEAGGKPSFAIARWDGPRASTARASLRSGRPNPFRASASFSYTIPTSGKVRISVHDVKGREIARLEDEDRPVGTYDATWNGRDRSGRKVPAGVYFVRAALPGGIQQSRKVVLLR